MYSLSQKLHFSLLASISSRYISICSFVVVLILVLGSPVRATQATDQLTQVFGDPDKFISNFTTLVKDRADQVVALLVAATGFNWVVRSFM